MIRFNLKQIINAYNSKHQKKPLTITSLSRLTGISRHSLSKLCDKYKQSGGIRFDTLDKLIQYFKLPVTSFITYSSNVSQITLKDATDTNFLKPKRSKYLYKMLRCSAYMTVLSNHQTESLLATPTAITDASNYTFMISFFPIKKEISSFNTVFNNSITNEIKSYLYARILAHSGMLSHKMVKHFSDLKVYSKLTNSNDLKLSSGLNQNYIFGKKMNLKDVPNSLTISDKTSNNLKE